MKRLLLPFLLFGLALLTGCGGSGGGGGQNTTTPSNTVTPTLQGLQVSPGSASTGVGGTQQFTAKGSFSDGSSKDLTSSAQWSSSDTAFATVSSSGLASGVAVGVVTIKAVSGSVQATAVLTVTNAGTNLTSITVSPSGTSIPINTSEQFSATGNFSDGSARDLTLLVSWSSSAGVATIDEMRPASLRARPPSLPPWVQSPAPRD